MGWRQGHDGNLDREVTEHCPSSPPLPEWWPPDCCPDPTRDINGISRPWAGDSGDRDMSGTLSIISPLPECCLAPPRPASEDATSPLYPENPPSHTQHPNLPPPTTHQLSRWYRLDCHPFSTKKWTKWPWTWGPKCTFLKMNVFYISYIISKNNSGSSIQIYWIGHAPNTDWQFWTLTTALLVECVLV